MHFRSAIVVVVAAAASIVEALFTASLDLRVFEVRILQSKNLVKRRKLEEVFANLEH